MLTSVSFFYIPTFLIHPIFDEKGKFKCNILPESRQMDFISSTSSDSELESKIKLKPLKKKIVRNESKLINYQMGVFCQKGGKLFEYQQKSQQKFNECTKVRMNI